MAINPINSNNHAIYTHSAHSRSKANAEQKAPVATDEAVSVKISSDALDKYAAEQNRAAGANILNEASIGSALPSRDEVSARKAALQERGNIQEIEVTGIYDEGTLAHFVDTQLTGKLEKSNQIAEQMENMIRGAVHNKDATSEQRAIDREAALKLAQHIAANYFENPEEAKAFMDTINKFAENDIMRDKGYVVFDNSSIEPFKSYTMPGAPTGYVRGYYDALRDIMYGETYKTPAEKEDAATKLRNDTVKNFDDNEKSVNNIVDRVKSAMSGIAVDNSFASSLEKMFSAISPAQARKWNDIVSLLNPKQ